MQARVRFESVTAKGKKGSTAAGTRSGRRAWPSGCRWALAVVGILAACSISRHYTGYSARGNGYVAGVVSSDTEERTRAFVAEAVREALEGDVPSVRGRFTPSLRKIVPADSLEQLLLLLRTRFRSDGQALVQPTSLNVRAGVGHPALDRDGLAFYSFVQVDHLLPGRLDALLSLFLTGDGTATRICGIKLRDLDFDDSGARLEKGWLMDQGRRVPLVRESAFP